MNNQQKLLYINEKDLQDVILYLKDYGEMIGKFYIQTTDVKTKQELALLSLNVNNTIKKLEKEI